jgi:hypothetical protein
MARTWLLLPSWALLNWPGRWRLQLVVRAIDFSSECPGLIFQPLRAGRPNKVVESAPTLKRHAMFHCWHSRDPRATGSLTGSMQNNLQQVPKQPFATERWTRAVWWHAWKGFAGRHTVRTQSVRRGQWMQQGFAEAGTVQDTTVHVPYIMTTRPSAR